MLYFANDLIPAPPNLTSTANSVSGTGLIPGNFVGVYRNLTVVPGGDSTLCDCEGEDLMGVAVVDGQGNWTLTHNLGLTPAEQGSVTATQTDALGNTSEFTQSCTGANPVGVEEAFSLTLRVFPNPADGVFALRLGETLSEGGQVSIFDPMGRLVFFDVLVDSELEVDARSWSSGIYFVRVETASGVAAERLWKR